MVLCKVKNLVGNETLARSVLTDDFQMILKEGTVLKQAYIDKLIELEIDEVMILGRKTQTKDEAISILKEDIAVSFKDRVQNILEKHTYQHNEELAKLSNTADNIITNILTEEQVVEKIFDIKERSADIYEHSISICTLATLTALKIGIEQDIIHDIGIACLLHDLGLRYLTISYENQDIATLSDLDLNEYKKHPVYGYSTLKSEKWISERSKQMILYHHERLDGSGYPLRARDIPKECRLIELCDAFDEMICGIGCKRMKVYEAVEYLKTYKGIQFDEELTEVFLTFIAVYPVGSQVKTNEGEIGIVVRQNKSFPERPVIKIVQDINGNEIENGQEKDLLKILNVVITEVLE